MYWEKNFCSIFFAILNPISFVGFDFFLLDWLCLLNRTATYYLQVGILTKINLIIFVTRLNAGYFYVDHEEALFKDIPNTAVLFHQK
jgi:hypothetical protein